MLASIFFFLSAFFWLRASRINLSVSGAIGGPFFPRLDWKEKCICIFYTPNSAKLDKCFSLSGWLNCLAATFAAVGSILTALSNYESFYFLLKLL